MEEKWKPLYDDLQQATAGLLRSPLTMESAETGYKESIDFWIRAKALIPSHGFPDEVAEIAFFSAVKPPFAAHCELFISRYLHALSCPPEPAEAIGYCRHELEKIERFRDQHSAFLVFYRSRVKENFLARYYFLRQAFDPDRRRFSRPYDANPDYFTNGDWIATQFIGNLCYKRFLQHEIRRNIAVR